MNRSHFVSGLALLTTLSSLAAQDQAPFATLAAPSPELDTSLPADVLRQTAAKSQWKSSVNIGASLTSGNTAVRTANVGADASREVGLHKTTLFFTWNYVEQKNDAKMWELNQRRTTGGAKHQKYFSAAKNAYGFAAVDAENNYNQNIALRLTGTAGIGSQVLNKDDLKVSIEIGAGYYSETSRTSGVADQNFTTGRFGWDIDWQISESWQFLQTAKYFFSLEEGRNQYGQVDNKLRVTMGEGMFAQAQWILQWDNTPSFDATGHKAHSLDHTFLLSVGWSF